MTDSSADTASFRFRPSPLVLEFFDPSIGEIPALPSGALVEVPLEHDSELEALRWIAQRDVTQVRQIADYSRPELSEPQRALLAERMILAAQQLGIPLVSAPSTSQPRNPVFRNTPGTDWWHCCTNCPDWPTEGDDFTFIPSGEVCHTCQRLVEERNCGLLEQ